MTTPTRPTTPLTTAAPDMSSAANASCCGDDCCGETAGIAPTATSASVASATSTAEAVREQVRAGYSKIARTGSWSSLVDQAGSASSPSAARNVALPSACCGGGSSTAGGGCCGPATFSPEQLAQAIGYSQDELTTAPEGANLGLSCGNPTAIASLAAGEIVLDLGSGGGFDCFIAGPKVGATGRVIGVDMTPDMLDRARRNRETYRAQTGLDNVEFRLGEIEHLPVADGSVDVVISNCVLNLSPDKPQVWREISRVLRTGGRVAVSDLALRRQLPDAVRADLEALVGCIAGAVLIDEMRRDAERAGLDEIVFEEKSGYVDAMTDWQDPLYRRIVESLPEGTTPADFIVSVDISARKRS